MGGSGNGYEEFQRLLFLDHECLLSYAVGLTLKVLTPFFLIPAPNVAGQSTLKFASCPATFLSFVIGNDNDAEWGGANCEAGRSGFRIGRVDDQPDWLILVCLMIQECITD